jgi:acyl dehydratase
MVEGTFGIPGESLHPGYTRSFELRRTSLELQRFEDLPLGSEWITRRRTVGQAEVTAFLGLSGDLNPLYADVEYARNGPFGQVVVPGALIAALAIGLGTIDGPVPATVGLVGMTWRFQRPVHVGDTIRCRWRLHRKRDVENPHWGLAVWQVEVENQHGEVVATAELARLVSRRQVPTETRSGKKRRRRGLETGAPALPPKPAPGPLHELPSEPGRWPSASRAERSRPPEPSKPKRIADHGSEGGTEKAPDGTVQRVPDLGRRPPNSTSPTLPEPAKTGLVSQAPGPQASGHAPEPASGTPEPVKGSAHRTPGGEEINTQTVVGQEKSPGVAVEAGPTFAPLAPESSWPPTIPPMPVTAEASEVKPASRRRRAPTTPKPQGDLSPTPLARRRRRRHTGELGSTASPEPPSFQETAPAPETQESPTTAQDHRRHEPVAYPHASPSRE